MWYILFRLSCVAGTPRRVIYVMVVRSCMAICILYNEKHAFRVGECYGFPMKHVS